MRPWTMLAGLNGVLAIGFAAYGAHGVDAGVAPLVEKGSLFQLIHAVALLSMDRLARQGRRIATLGGIMIASGIVLFSGSLYFKAIFGPLPLPMVTPAGGISLMLGWGMIAVAAIGRDGHSSV